MKKLLAVLAVMASGCPDVTVDPDETQQGPVVEFDPARSQATKARFIPFPNDLVRDPATGKVNLPEQACENPTSKATRENVLNQLDGFGTYQTAMQVSFTAPVDPASLEGNIVMYQLTDQGMPLSPESATPVPVTIVRVGETPRFETGNCDKPETANAITFVPNVPLRQKSTYFVTLLKGIKDTSGVEFTGSYTWGLVKAEESPVTVDEAGNILSERTPLDPANEAQRAQLQSLAMMWKLHSTGLGFYMATPNARPREDILVGFQFSTQTVTDPLDPTVMGSPASKLANVAILQLATVTNKFSTFGSTICAAKLESDQTQCFLKLALGGCNPLTSGCTGDNYDVGHAACQLYSCADIANVLGGGVINTNYQTQVPNAFDAQKPIQGAWSDPLKPEQQASLTLETLVTVPTSNPPQNNGYPVVIFAHGLGSSKEAALAIAGRLADAGYATVAIDTSAHGSRAVRISNDPALGCTGQCISGGTPTGTPCESVAQCGSGQTCGKFDPATAAVSLAPPSPTTTPQCYAPFLSPDLEAVRDGIRQTVLDHQRLVKAVKACGTTACAGFPVNADRVYFLGMSLGGIIGSISASTTADIDTSVLNVPGVGWADILENTETLQIRCSLVNGLIDAKILTGEKWAGGSTGLCLTDAWKTQPGYATFAAIGRWVLDPADGANYASRLATERILIQEVVGDTVVPNISTDRLAALTGLAQTPLAGDPFNGQPSAALSNMPMTNKFVRYTNNDTNVFVHSSLLRPAPTNPAQAGINGTLRLVTDAIYFLVNNP